MKRRTALAAFAAAGASAAFAAMPGYRRDVVAQFLAAADTASSPPDTASPDASPAVGPASPWALKLLAAAEAQIGVTVTYDPAYVRLAYPGGDVPRDRGVCTDVVVRAYRDGLGVDLQRLVHEDMAAHFSAYPTRWGLKRPDTHIDHRRVPNLQTFFARRGAAVSASQNSKDYAPGDLVTMLVGVNLPHIAIVSHRASADGERPLIVHNIGAGTRLEDRLFEFPLTGHYRFAPRTS